MSRYRSISTDEICQLLEDRLEDLIAEFWPGAIVDGGVAYCSAKSRADLGSFQVALRTVGRMERGRWRRYSQRIGGSVLNLVVYGLSGERHHTGDYREAVGWAKRWLGLDGEISEAERDQLARDRQRREREAQEAQARQRQRTIEHVSDIWRECLPIGWDNDLNPVVMYLTRARGLPAERLAAIKPQLFWHPKLGNWKRSDWIGPAMVARPRSPNPGVFGLHLTWVKPDRPGKAPLGKHAKLMRGDVLGGAVILSRGPSGLSLHDLAAQGGRVDVILCEGIETGLALACAIPEAAVWACLSIANIGAAPIDHAAVGRVFVALENDVSAQAISQRETALDLLEASGKPIGTMKSHVGSDFADLMV